MRTLTQCLLSCVFLLCGLANLVAAVAQLKHHYSEIHNRHGKLVRHYIEGGIVYGECETYSKMNVFLTTNGKNVTGQEEWISFIATGQSLKYKISLNRSTPFGEYRCHAGDEFKVTHTIQYILCDPDKIIPEKECQKGQFCVINGSNTKCQSQIDCEQVTYPKECSNKTVLKDTSHPLCSVYRDAHNIPAGYYLETNPFVEDSFFPFRTGPCIAEPTLLHKGKSIEFYSTVPIGNSSELKELGQHLAVKRANDRTTCHMHTGSVKKEKSLDEMLNGKDLGMFLSQEMVPEKTYAECLTIGRGLGFKVPKGRLDFYILFYEKNVRFHIIQKKHNMSVNVTKITNKVIWLGSPTSYICSVSVHGGLFVKASRTEENSTGKPHPGEASVELEYKKDSKIPSVCWAYVYFYEQMGDMGFKELYREKREILAGYSTTSTESSTSSESATTVERGTTNGRGSTNGRSSTTATKGSPAVLIGVGVGIAFGAVILLIAVVLGILAYRKKKVQHKGRDASPLPFRSVRAPETDRFESMTTEASAKFVSVGRPQTSQVSGVGSLFYKSKSKPRKRTGSSPTGVSHLRRTSQDTATGKPKSTRKRTRSDGSRHGSTLGI